MNFWYAIAVVKPVPALVQMSVKSVLTMPPLMSPMSVFVILDLKDYLRIAFWLVFAGKIAPLVSEMAKMNAPAARMQMPVFPLSIHVYAE